LPLEYGDAGENDVTVACILDGAGVVKVKKEHLAKP
jgi:hypothetical protein